MSIPNTTFDVLSHGSLLAFPLVMIAGAMAGFNPCCVALYPSAAAIWCGSNSTDASCGAARQKWMLKYAIAFILGVATATTVLGVVAAVAGRIVGQLGSGVRYAVAGVPLVMGLHLLGWLRLPIASLPYRVSRTGWIGAYCAGFLLSLALTPCGTPVLASVLSYVAYKGRIVYGAILLFLYGVGSGVPVVLVGTVAGQMTMRLGRAGYGLWLERTSGAALVALGLFLVWKA